jgi:cytochrome oxidase assembly protein ShyY1
MWQVHTINWHSDLIAEETQNLHVSLYSPIQRQKIKRSPKVESELMVLAYRA